MSLKGVGCSGKTPKLTASVLHSRHLAKRVQVGSPGYCMVTKMPITREVGE